MGKRIPILLGGKTEAQRRLITQAEPHSREGWAHDVKWDSGSAWGWGPAPEVRVRDLSGHWPRFHDFRVQRFLSQGKDPLAHFFPSLLHSFRRLRLGEIEAEGREGPSFCLPPLSRPS